MEEGKRYFRLGLFVFVALVAAAAVLFVLGGRSLFQPTFTFETYFNQSVAGLSVGAPVEFRGVPLGQVTEILTSYVEYEAHLPLNERLGYIVVRAKVNVSRQQVRELEDDVDGLIKKGLRAQTQL